MNDTNVSNRWPAIVAKLVFFVAKMGEVIELKWIVWQIMIGLLTGDFIHTAGTRGKSNTAFT
ncbi:hypothetical protein [Dyadobacter diqingensis]|uniref:hypothetical protein n=1 Tax=Dyadobacter diqingensis TaxID=2938121 RepID=UPI0020C31865|nr:hypothetical protein [Dyadobacter diqingensis]